MVGAAAWCVALSYSSCVIRGRSALLLTMFSLIGAGRETFLVKVDWVDDWPVFNEGKNIALLTQGRDPKSEATEPQDEDSTWSADLNKSDLELGWYQKSEIKTLLLLRRATVFHAEPLESRYATQAVLLPHRETRLPSTVRELLRPVQPGVALDAPEEADGIHSIIQGDNDVQPIKGRL